jgi:hypothetical protein
VKLDIAKVRALFDAALLTDEEFARGPDAWLSYPDPFPQWYDSTTHQHAR